MKINFSSSIGSFYPLDIDYGNNIPSDVQIVDYDLYLQAMARPDGSTFDIIDGALVITAAPVPDYAPQRDGYLVTVRATREQILNRLAGIGMAAIISADTPTAQGVATARLSLLGITTLPDVLAARNLDELKTAILAAYRSIVASAPAAVRSAFNLVDV